MNSWKSSISIVTRSPLRPPNRPANTECREINTQPRHTVFGPLGAGPQVEILTDLSLTTDPAAAIRAHFAGRDPLKQCSSGKAP